MCFTQSSLLSVVAVCFLCPFIFFFFKQKTAYEMRISDWSSDVCSSDLKKPPRPSLAAVGRRHCLMTVPDGNVFYRFPGLPNETGIPSGFIACWTKAVMTRKGHQVPFDPA